MNERCYICNKVSSELIETNPGDFLKKHFAHDPHDENRSICEECLEAHNEAMLAYEAKDDMYSWRTEEVYANDNEDIRDDILMVELGDTFYTDEDEIQD